MARQNCYYVNHKYLRVKEKAEYLLRYDYENRLLEQNLLY